MGQGNEPVAVQLLRGESALESAMMDQGEQVDFLTELHSQPPVTVSFQGSHGKQQTAAPSPGADRQGQSGDQTLASSKRA